MTEAQKIAWTELQRILDIVFEQWEIDGTAIIWERSSRPHEAAQKLCVEIEQYANQAKVLIALLMAGGHAEVLKPGPQIVVEWDKWTVDERSEGE